MASNKHALIRYRILDRCFSNPGKEYTIDDLIEECCNVLEKIDSNTNGISLKTIRNDIAFMKSEFGWNIELGKYKQGKKMYYRYADASFSISKMPLNELEISQLQSALDILTQFKGMPQFEWMYELLPKLKQGIDIEKNTGIILEFDSNPYLKGIENLGPLYNAILFKKVLLCKYQPFENETPFDVVLHPYYLKQYNNRWFLFGFNPATDKYNWNLAIDRIVTIKEIKGRYQKNISINWQFYFDDIIGVTMPENGMVENITLHFYGKTGKYMETKPLHGSQKSKWIDDNTLEVNLQLIINYEFERLILSYADSVKVIKPVGLATSIESRLKAACVQYAQDGI